MSGTPKSNTPESAAPGAETPAGSSSGGVPAEWLETPEEEADELGRLIAAGHRAGGVTGGLTFLGVALMLAALMIYHFDRMPGQTPFPDQLNGRVAQQAARDFEAYRSGGTVAAVSPEWPLVAQRRARDDAFLAAGLALVIGYVFLQIERAKLRRQDLLVYRALAREVEKLRQRVQRIERGPRSGDDGSA